MSRESKYSDADRLLSVVKKNPATQVNESKSEFVYDGLSRLRISREYSWNATAWVLVAGSEKRRVYDGMDVIQERDGTNAVTATYTRSGNIGGLLAKQNAQGDFFYFHYDGSGNVTELTDANQNTVAEYSYDAFGNTLSSNGAQAGSNAYRYSTKELMSGGLYNYGYRFYSAGLGRFINRDPIKERGGINLYSAFGNSPTNNVDLYGLLTWEDWWNGNVRDPFMGNPNEIPDASGDPEDMINEVEARHDQVVSVGAKGTGDAYGLYGEGAEYAATGGGAGKAAGAGIALCGLRKTGKGWTYGTKLIDQLKGKGQLAALRRNPNFKGVDLEDLLQKMPEEIESLVKQGLIDKKTLRQLEKAFEFRADIRHGK